MGQAGDEGKHDMSDPTTIEELIEATIQARQVIREAHEATKDLKQDLQALKLARKAIFADWEAKAREMLEKLSTDMLQQWNDQAIDLLGDALERSYPAFLSRLRRGL